MPGRKRPVAYSNKSTGDLIGIVSEIFYSIKDVQRAILYDEKAKEILQMYIDKGYGNDEASKYFEFNELSYSLNWLEKPYAILDSNMPSGILSSKEILEFEYVLGKRKWKFKKDVREYGLSPCCGKL